MPQHLRGVHNPQSADLPPVQAASPPPTSVTVASGNGDTVYYRDDHTMVFAVWTGSLALGPQSNGQAQEQLIDRYMFSGVRLDNPNWLPDIATDTFRLTHGLIYDTQRPDPGDFLTARIGGTLPPWRKE